VTQLSQFRDEDHRRRGAAKDVDGVPFRFEQLVRNRSLDGQLPRAVLDSGSQANTAITTQSAHGFLMALSS